MDQLKNIKTFFNQELSPHVAFVKVGTESEAMTLQQISLLMSITNTRIVCKIGGPDAQSDILGMHAIGISSFVAPMIESPFSVKKYNDAVSKTIGFDSAEELCINIESIIAFANIDDILQSANNIHRVNVGFSDLAASMGTDVMDPGVLRLGKSLRKKCKIIGKPFSFGGTVTPENIEPRLACMEPDGFETRLLGFQGNVNHPALIVRKALEFEEAFENYLADIQQTLLNLNTRRIAAIRKRLNTMSLAA